MHSVSSLKKVSPATLPSSNPVLVRGILQILQGQRPKNTLLRDKPDKTVFGSTLDEFLTNFPPMPKDILGNTLKDTSTPKEQQRTTKVSQPKPSGIALQMISTPQEWQSWGKIRNKSVVIKNQKFIG